MKIPFKTHKIFVTLDDDKMYQLFADFSKKEVEKPKELTEILLTQSRKKPFMVVSGQHVIDALTNERIEIAKEFEILKSAGEDFEFDYNSEYKAGFDHAIYHLQDILQSAGILNENTDKRNSE
ncbi:hypothetical protein UP12_19430 (plasmid) [Bacillus pumilus]|uniref:hypothetical protein n=1 Tax=Bacillus pumilus TaxID=1408 RepID=UPI000776342C|nr:hypothetical protein [Bacillus pumilus]AMM99582.1 hypothetical protein UP12_19430 [Bacillus pumilus]